MSGVSAVILTYNEEDHISSALDSVSWCDEIFLVDSQSTDATREIAREFGAKIIDAPKPNPCEPYDHLRQLGVDEADNDLIIVIDADETHPPKLQSRLKEISQRPLNEIGVVKAPTCNYFNGVRLKGGSQWLGTQVVLFNSNLVEFEPAVHRYWDYDESNIEVLPTTTDIAIQHEFTESLYDYWQTQRRYAKIAGNNREFSPFLLLVAPVWVFYKKVILQSGWHDGLTGVGIGLCYSWYRFELNFWAAIRHFVKEK